MPTTFRPYELDPTAFHAPYGGAGRRNAPYGPRMMVKVLLYGYATGVFPSRGIAGRPEDDVAFRVSGAGNLPGRRTLCGFRRRHPEDFKGLFVEVVRVAHGMGLESFGKLSADGTKVRANALRSDASEGAGAGGGDQDVAGPGPRYRCAGGRTLRGSFRGDELPEELRRAVAGPHPPRAPSAAGGRRTEYRADGPTPRSPG